MKTTRKWGLILVCGAAVFAGCRGGSAPELPVSDRSFQPQQPQEDFGRFVYRKEKHRGVEYGRYLSSANPVVLATYTPRKKLYGDMELFLLESDQFILVYKESLACHRGDRQASVLVHHQVVRGTWGADNQQLKVGRVGRAIAETTCGEPGVGFQYLRNLSAPGLTDQKFSLCFQLSTSDLSSEVSYHKTFSMEEAERILSRSEICKP